MVCPYRSNSYQPRKFIFSARIVFWAMVLGLAIIFWASSCNSDPVWAAEVVYSDEQIANAIYKAEGGAKTSHPYGILAHYKKTTPRQACINTIRHARRDWNNQGDFIRFLQQRYAPIGVANDPRGLNRNWYGNVTKFLVRAK